MGYLVQISNEAGTVVFQAAKNYPEVSFASGGVLHALITASLKQDFTPSVLRTQDAAAAFAVHGPDGSRLRFALVTSEISAGQSRDLEARLQWRLHIVYRAALLAAGGEALRRGAVAAQPEQLRRLLAQRLSPVVSHIMAEDSAPALAGQVPSLGLAVPGAAVEWLARTSAADAALEALLSALGTSHAVASPGSSDRSPANVGASASKGNMPSQVTPNGSAADLSALGDMVAMLSWQGRALAVTPAWRRSVLPVDRALLLALAEQVGPMTFERPSRSWAYEELANLWLPSAAAAGIHYATDAAGTGDQPAGADFIHPSIDGFVTPLPVSARAKQYRMVSARLYPTLEPAPVESGSATAGGSAASSSTAAVESPNATAGKGSACSSSAPCGGQNVIAGNGAASSSSAGRAGAGLWQAVTLCEDCRQAPYVAKTSATSLDDQPPAPWWDGRATDAESAGIWAEESSLVVSVLDEVGQSGGISAAQLQHSAALCEAAFRELWRSLRRPGGGGGAMARQLLRHTSGNLEAFVLYDELSHDVVSVPSPWHSCAVLPWQCHGRRKRSAALRRILYWIHALPPLAVDRSQQYVVCEGYTVAAIRRDDGVQCWAIMDGDPELDNCVSASSGVAGINHRGEQTRGESRKSESGQGRVLAAAAKVLREVPRSVDLRSMFAGG